MHKFNSKLHNNFRELKRLALAIDCHTYLKNGLTVDPQDFIDTRQDKLCDNEYIKESCYVTAQERENQEKTRIEETIKRFVNKKA